jgi:hypothetical protein
MLFRCNIPQYHLDDIYYWESGAQIGNNICVPSVRPISTAIVITIQVSNSMLLAIRRECHFAYNFIYSFYYSQSNKPDKQTLMTNFKRVQSSQMNCISITRLQLCSFFQQFILQCSEKKEETERAQPFCSFTDSKGFNKSSGLFFQNF